MNILKEEENINQKKAIFSFAFVSLFLILGKIDFYVDETLIQVRRILFPDMDCKIILTMSHYLVPFHNAMPIVVGSFILYIIQYMANAQMNIIY